MLTFFSVLKIDLAHFWGLADAPEPLELCLEAAATAPCQVQGETQLLKLYWEWSWFCRSMVIKFCQDKAALEDLSFPSWRDL